MTTTKKETTKAPVDKELEAVKAANKKAKSVVRQGDSIIVNH